MIANTLTETPSTIDDITSRICQQFGVKTEEVKGRSRAKKTREARQIICYVSRKLGYTYESIALSIDKDHSTVIHSVKVVSNEKPLKRVADPLVFVCNHSAIIRTNFVFKSENYAFA